MGTHEFTRDYPYLVEAQQLITEVYHKELLARLEHCKVNKDYLAELTVPSDAYKVRRRGIVGGIPVPVDRIKHLLGRKNIRYPLRSKPDMYRKNLVEIASHMADEEPNMCPPDCEMLDVLYEGLSHEQEGRYKYLRQRYCLLPEDKFLLPPLESRVYGWRLRNFVDPDESRNPDWARRRVLEPDMYRRNGIKHMQMWAVHGSPAECVPPGITGYDSPVATKPGITR